MRRLQPLFFLALLSLFILPGPAHATSQYVGYAANQADSGSCTGTFCIFTSATTEGWGTIFQAPFTGTLTQASVFTGTTMPDKIVVLTYPAGTSPATTQYGVGICNVTSQCRFTNNGQTFTVADVESLTGLSSLSLNTVSLASPISVSTSQWIAIVWMHVSGVVATNTFTMGACGGSSTSCASPGTTVASVAFDFPSTSPALASTITVAPHAGCTDSSCQNPSTTGATFQTAATQPQFVTQCYGNCGTPAVTLANTNTTHLTNWNLSITQFYAVQSNLNGFVVNVTVPVARTYTNGNGLTLGLYSVDPTCSSQPFSPSCPGFLQSSQLFTNPAKGNAVMLVHFSVTNGQWFGVSVSGSFTGLDLNDTNTNVHLLQVAGRSPNTITAYSDLGNRLTGLYGFVQGNTVTSGGGVNPAGCGTVQCYLGSFVSALGGGILGGLAAFGILFGLLGGLGLYATRQHDSNGHISGYAIPMEFLLVIAVLLLIGLSVAGVLPPYIPLIVIALVAWMFTSAIWGRNKNTASV